MSSRVLLPDDPRSAAPVVWRQMHGVGGSRPAASGEEAAGFRERLAQMQQQCEQRVRDAHTAGAHEGETAGRHRAAAELQPVMDRLARSIEEVGSLRARLRSEAEGDLIQLALAIARRVLRREMAVDPEALHGLILGALQKLQGQEISRVRVHPSHAALVTACLQQVATGCSVEVISDPSREPGAVIFETQRGNLDASVESQLQEIERGLTDRLRKQS
jgi:flagellar assembly protein FliH